MIARNLRVVEYDVALEISPDGDHISGQFKDFAGSETLADS
jgi:hypothetical protein